jgi:hypothetical protein
MIDAVHDLEVSSVDDDKSVAELIEEFHPAGSPAMSWDATPGLRS